MSAEVIAALASRTTVITANRRLAHTVLREYASHQRAQGRTAWAAPAALTLDDWLSRCFADFPGDAPLLLTGAQEGAVWADIIDHFAGAGTLLDLEATAAAAAGAWRLAHEWQLTLTDAAWRETPDTEAFLEWALGFRRRCRERGWITAAELPAQVGAAITRGEYAAPAAQLWLGFDLPTPAQGALREALQRAGVRVTLASAETAGGAPPRRFEACDEEEELRQAARWARRQLEGSASASIGVLVPHLSELRDRVERIFDEELDADRDPRRGAARAFHLSLGRPLAQQPVVAAALRLLEAAAPNATLPWSLIEFLLRTPFVQGAESEAGARSRLERRLRQFEETRLSLDELAAQARDGCPQLSRALPALAREAAPDQRSYAEWAAAFEAMLAGAGWPGVKPSSEEFQAIEAWRQQLDGFVRLDQVAEKPDFLSALHRLRRMAEQIFQPRSPDPPIEIMDWREAAGFHFECLWVAGLRDDRLPAAARPHPFLPGSLQRAREMPHSSAAVEKAFADRLIARALGARRDLVLSWPAANELGPLHPSSIAILAAGNAVWHAPEPPPPAGPLAEMSEIPDDLAPPATGPELAVPARALEDQAACGFRAFIHHRLDAQGFEPVHAGLSPARRGTLLHRALERFFRELQQPEGTVPGTLERLQAMPEAEIAARITAAVEAALEPERWSRRRPRLAEVERARLRFALRHWVAHEMERAPFNVLELESKQVAEFSGLVLHLRLDRVDEVAGERVLLDYKSERVRPDWDGERPQSPQLPIYAVLEGERATLAAVALACLKPGAPAFVGEATAEGLLPKLGKGAKQKLRPERIAEWRRAVEGLAAAYREGVAAIDPFEGAQTCRRCDLAPLCRIHEVEAWGGEDEDDDE